MLTTEKEKATGDSFDWLFSDYLFRKERKSNNNVASENSFKDSPSSSGHFMTRLKIRELKKLEVEKEKVAVIAVLNRQLNIEEAPKHAGIHCLYYDRCLAFATNQNFPQFSCLHCQYFKS